MLSNIVSSWLDSCPLFEQHCVLCGQRPVSHGLCAGCVAALPYAPQPRCPQCGVLAASAAVPCGACQRQPPAFDRLLAAYDYAYPLEGLITRCKYAPAPALQRALAALLPMALQRGEAGAAPDLLVAMPSCAPRLAARGFNLPDALAAALAATMRAPLDGGLCWRKRNTPPQVALDRRARLANMRDAFGVKRCCDGLFIAIVDDVASTGASLHALAKTLKKAGAKRVDAWVLARAHVRHA